MIVDEQTYLEHYGVKGMKWGIRKDRTGSGSGTSRKTERAAKKDAKELARAKMYYGEGAGTRRKLIRESTEAKRKKDPAYSKALDRHLQRETANLDRHATKAQRERKRTDRKDTAKKSGAYLARLTTGEMGTKAAVTAVVITGATYLNSEHGRRTMNRTINQAKQISSKYMPSNRPNTDMADSISEWLRKNS